MILLCSWAFAAAVLGRPLLAAAEEPSITVVLPSTDELFKDFKLAFDLAKDEKGYNTLKETIETFLVGVDTTKAAGVRIYATPDGLQYVLTFPISNYKKLVSNLWDLDVRTAPAPTPQLIKQIPPAIAQKVQKLKLAPNERLVFKLFEGFLSHEAAIEHVHMGKQLEDVRAAKGILPVGLVKGHDLAIKVDGKSQPAEKRKQAFDKVKKELLAAITRGEHESEAAFAVRKVISEHQIAELERFFVESAQVLAGWNVSETEKMAVLNLDLEALPGTELEKSVQLVGQGPDEFAGVSKSDTVFSLSLNFALDALRKDFVKSSVKFERELVKKEIADRENLSAEQKAVDGDVADIFFDLLEGSGELGLANLFLRTWRGPGNSLITVAGGKIPEGQKSKIETILDNLASHGTESKVEKKVDAEGDIEIHKLTLPRFHELIPELTGADAVVYVGLSEKTAWLSAGDNSLARLKTAIQQAAAAGAKPGPDVDLTMSFAPYVGMLDSYRKRNPSTEPAKTDTTKKKTGTKVSEKSVQSLISPTDLRQIALDAFNQGQDVMAFSIHREGQIVKVHARYDEGLIRFVGKVLSKFVKDNLEDE
jgi:hypothetical protein